MTSTTNNALPPAKLMTELAVVELTGIARGTLRNWRSERRGPTFVKFGNGAVRYRETDVAEWIEAALVPTRE